MIKVGIIGATGYAGANLVSLLKKHEEVQLVYLGSHHYVGKAFSEVYPAMLGACDDILKEDSVADGAAVSDVLFIALPAGVAGTDVTPEILDKCAVIDLGADFRLHCGKAYEQWYHLAPPSDEMLAKAVYGLPELHREAIKGAKLIANPGCYTTTSILSLKPVMDLIDVKSIIIDAASGVSGAGRSAKIPSLFCECNESMKAYGVSNHRHTPEIEQELGNGCMVQFTPHLAPMNRGILATCTANLKADVTAEQISAAYHAAYDNEPFVRIYGSAGEVETRFTAHTNSFAVGFTVDKRTGRIIIAGALDNLIKGAAGQAVQNMNIICGFPEGKALDGFLL